MPLFNVVFEVAGFADDADIDGRELTEQELEGFTSQSKKENLWPSNIESVSRAYVSVDDAQGDTDVHCFVNVTLVVSASSAKEAGKMTKPVRLLSQLVDSIASIEPAISFSIDGEWSIDDVSSTVE